MNYPQELPKHEIASFHSSTVLAMSSENRTKAYFHILHNNLLFLPMHSHDFYEINIITSGNAMHYINDKIYPAPQGTVFVIPPHYEHGYFSEESTQIFHLILDMAFINSYHAQLNALKGYSFLFDIEPILRKRNNINLFLTLSNEKVDYISPLIQRLCYYEEKFKENNFLTKEFLTLNLIAELCNFNLEYYPEKTTNTPKKTDEIIKIMEYISKNYHQKINFHTLAENFNMSYPTLFRNFVKLCSVTPTQYLTECRVNEAINLMNQNKLTLTEIALSCGFYDASHFTKTFISLKGFPPSNFGS